MAEEGETPVVATAPAEVPVELAAGAGTLSWPWVLAIGVWAIVAMIAVWPKLRSRLQRRDFKGKRSRLACIVPACDAMFGCQGPRQAWLAIVDGDVPGRKTVLISSVIFCLASVLLLAEFVVLYFGVSAGSFEHL